MSKYIVSQIVSQIDDGRYFVVFHRSNVKPMATEEEPSPLPPRLEQLAVFALGARQACEIVLAYFGEREIVGAVESDRLGRITADLAKAYSAGQTSSSVGATVSVSR